MMEERKNLEDTLIDMGYSREDAQNLIQEAREDLHYQIAVDGWIDDQDFMQDWFGLEPDWFDELLLP
jgi:hypothetical protein